MSMLDCVVIGGGPAGLTAAIYLARFRRTFQLIDGGDSRARWIPLSRNYPGFPDGIAGDALLERMRAQARRYEATLTSGHVQALDPAGDSFQLRLADGKIVGARKVILATGVTENQPGIPHLAEAVKRGAIRLCPICDGYESIGRTVAVVGDGDHAAAEALFVRTYSDRVTLILAGDATSLSQVRRRALAEADVEVIVTPIDRVRVEMDETVHVLRGAGEGERRFDILYSAFGVTPQAALAVQAGARRDADGRLIVGEHQETSVAGLYAAGDLVRGLNQISVAVGEAALAATAVHNRLPPSRA